MNAELAGLEGATKSNERRDREEQDADGLLSDVRAWIADPGQKIGRPRQLYVGEAPRDVTAITDR